MSVSDILVAVGLVIFLVKTDEIRGIRIQMHFLQFPETGYQILQQLFIRGWTTKLGFQSLGPSPSLLALTRTSLGTQSIVRNSSAWLLEFGDTVSLEFDAKTRSNR